MTPKEFRRIRTEAKLTQGELARWLRVEPRTVQKWEGKERAIPGPVEVLMELLGQRDWRLIGADPYALVLALKGGKR